VNSTEKLVYMANQIARNIAPRADEAAAEAVADHIGHFWDPRMKQMIFAHIDAGGVDLSPAALAGLMILRNRSATQAAQFANAPETGQPGAG
jgi:formate dehydrogenase subunit delta